MELSQPQNFAFTPMPVDAHRFMTASSPLEQRGLEDETCVDAAITSDVSLAAVWRELVSGSTRVVETYFTQARCCLVTQSVDADVVYSFHRRTRQVLELAMSASAQKTISVELGLAPSTIASLARQGLQRLGINEKPSHVHPLLMVAARAAAENDARVTGSRYIVYPEGSALSVISVARPERCLVGRIPGAELAVVQGALEGKTHAQIAQQRGTSTRTVANQLAAVFRKLRVSGRAELIHRLFALDAGRVGVDATALEN